MSFKLLMLLLWSNCSLFSSQWEYILLHETTINTNEQGFSANVQQKDLVRLPLKPLFFLFFFSTKCFFLWCYIFLKCATGISRRNWKLSLHLDHREKITVLTIILHPKSAIFSYRSKQAGFCCNLRISDNDMIFQKKW